MGETFDCPECRTTFYFSSRRGGNRKHKCRCGHVFKIKGRMTSFKRAVIEK